MADPTSRPGPRQLHGGALRDCGVEPGGQRIRLGLVDDAGRPADVTLPAECLAQLILTLPRLADEALRRRFRDDSLRIVYPLGPWRLETTSDGAALILTLGTADGLAVSFALAPERLDQFVEAAAGQPAPPLRPH